MSGDPASPSSRETPDSAPLASSSASDGGFAPLALELRAIEKRFGSVHANRAVSLRVRAGSIHGLIGENGAGKSTLMNIAYGYHQPDAGELLVGARAQRFSSPHDALAAGIGMVHQHFMLVEDFTALENIILGEQGGGQLVTPSLARARDSLTRLAGEFGLSVPLDVPVRTLPVGVQQRIEILKALHRGARVLILDEPTAVLTPAEVTQLFSLLRQLRAQGRSVILVTHKLREVMAVTDEVTVMRQGEVVARLKTSEASVEALAEHMVGRKVRLTVERPPCQPGETLLEASGLCLRDARGVQRLKQVSLRLRAGEIVGVAGVSGNGQTELLEVLAGVSLPEAGRLSLCGVDLLKAPTSVAGRRALGLAHVPEDRLGCGVVSSLSAAENALLGAKAEPGSGWFLSPRAVAATTQAQMEAFDVRPRLPGLRLGSFSGGNQQKLVLARETAGRPRVVLIGQPTRGVDIGAIEFIHRRIVEMSREGVAFLIVSVELEELLGLADRIVVMNDGQITGEVSGAEATEARIGLLMSGAGAVAPAAKAGEAQP